MPWNVQDVEIFRSDEGPPLCDGLVTRSLIGEPGVVDLRVGDKSISGEDGAAAQHDDGRGRWRRFRVVFAEESGIGAKLCEDMLSNIVAGVLFSVAGGGGGGREFPGDVRDDGVRERGVVNRVR